MPVPGIPNNPDGINGWEGFTAEPPYGDVTNQQRLTRAAPLAGAPLASGPISSPQQAQRRATRPQPTPTGVLPTLPAAAPSLKETWQQIAAIPGISPLAAQYAAKA